MEKRNYVKPATELYGINSTTSFMVTSDIVIGGETGGTEVATLLDECFMVDGYLSNNQSVIDQLGSDNTGCFYTRPDENDNPGVIVCKDPRFKDLRMGTGVKITYNPNAGTFTFSFEGCRNWYF